MYCNWNKCDALVLVLYILKLRSFRTFDHIAHDSCRFFVTCVVQYGNIHLPIEDFVVFRREKIRLTEIFLETLFQHFPFTFPNELYAEN
jgi:hypothetical protein